MDLVTSKRALRKKFLDRRRLSFSPAQRHQAETQVLAAAKPLLDSLKPGEAVASYLSFDTEVPTFLLNETILATGLKLVVPCGLEQSRWGELDPVQHTRALYRRFNPHPPLLSREMQCADLAKIGLKIIFLPALAVDRTGVRLGRGAGWYDQALLHCGTDCPTHPQLIAMVHDWEMLQAGALPREPHDQLVEQVLTPEGGLQKLEND
ncbi:5-formyltetrahydrofolate cyclo-ligase [Varibaculum vaginae]|uniref:5-formyltetrahydrofolate cyclo-ligase n=1 Tax=Varibaculum vaginae TaxID=2364797 RepID=UPI000F0936DE|nr:5-formyltetrahydrofolate cyclo-ligase [Varibaculum vaginae]